VPSYCVSLNSFFSAIFILKFLSFKLGYKCGSSSIQFLSINSFFNKNLLHSLEYIFSSLQFNLLYSSSKLVSHIFSSAETVVKEGEEDGEDDEDDEGEERDVLEDDEDGEDDEDDEGEERDVLEDDDDDDEEEDDDDLGDDSEDDDDKERDGDDDELLFIAIGCPNSFIVIRFSVLMF